ncbi:MAG TPA: response regulator transcription factor [Candidatus Nanopelagicales bacterium]|jgi:DNA-binding NarL/FixJ family response regulator
MTTVLVCDDAPLAREALRRAVAAVPGVERVTGAGSGEEVLARYPLERPSVVLMDVRMPGMGGVEATRRLLGAHPGAIVVMLTMGEDVDGVAAAMSAGARGYMVKDASREETAAVLGLATTAPAHRMGNVVPLPVRQQASGPALSERELEVLEGMSRGKSNAQIGRELYLSEDTIKTHARRLFRKMGAADRAQAVALGFRWGLLS